jgi:glycyl-tRNA synthetase beta subunit
MNNIVPFNEPPPFDTDFEEIDVEQDAMIERLSVAAANSLEEAVSAASKWPPMNSAHEAFAVLHEEFDELWEHVKVNQKRRDYAAMRQEAIQVAAMALRFVADICDTENRK